MESSDQRSELAQIREYVLREMTQDDRFHPLEDYTSTEERIAQPKRLARPYFFSRLVPAPIAPAFFVRRFTGVYEGAGDNRSRDYDLASIGSEWKGNTIIVHEIRDDQDKEVLEKLVRKLSDSEFADSLMGLDQAFISINSG